MLCIEGGYNMSFKKIMDKAIKTCDLNKNPDDRVYNIVGKYSVQWNKGTGYFEIRKSGKLVGHASTFEEARKQAYRLNSEDD